jgi:hypothetical protein
LIAAGFGTLAGALLWIQPTGRKEFWIAAAMLSAAFSVSGALRLAYLKYRMASEAHDALIAICIVSALLFGFWVPSWGLPIGLQETFNFTPASMPKAAVFGSAAAMACGFVNAVMATVLILKKRELAQTIMLVTMLMYTVSLLSFGLLVLFDRSFTPYVSNHDQTSTPFCIFSSCFFFDGCLAIVFFST